MLPAYASLAAICAVVTYLYVLSGSMISKILRNVAEFLSWLADQRGFEPQFTASDTDYLNPTSEMREAMKRRPIVSVPDKSQLEAAVLAMPCRTIFEQRNRAAMALLLLCGARANAHASLRVRSVDCVRQLVDQDGILVRTKKLRDLVFSGPVRVDPRAA